MKDIRKIFNIKDSNKSLFTFGELVFITISFTIICCFLTGIIIYNGCNQSFGKDPARDDILDTYDKIKNSYYQSIDSNEVADAAIEGMLTFLNEKYSVYMDSNDTDDLQSRLSGNYEGIGIGVLKRSDGHIIVRFVYDNTPALKAGLKSNDEIIEVNGKKIDEETEVTDLLAIIEDSNEVEMTVLRNGKEHIFRMQKVLMNNPVTVSKTFEGEEMKVGYIYLSAFSNDAFNQVKKSLEQLESDGITSLILDLRSNSGGYLNAATDIANMFLRKGDVIYSLEKKDKREYVYDTTDEHRKMDIVILIDENTASASELLASALHDSYGALIVGHQSYGKGRVQELSTLSDDTMIKFTTAKWFTPLGDSIDTIGITPDITANLTEKYLNAPEDANDDQLQMALNILFNR